MLNTIKVSITFFIVLNFCRIVKPYRDFHTIYRELWRAIPIVDTDRFPTKLLPYVIVHESGGPTCDDIVQCSQRLRDLQMADVSSKMDIRYNFLIGGDGVVYEGRGWYRQGSNIPEYDSKSISIAFIGTFSDSVYLTEQAWFTFKKVINFGAEIGYLSENHQILGHRQFHIISGPNDIYEAECPGMNVYKLLYSLPRWMNVTFQIHR